MYVVHHSSIHFNYSAERNENKKIPGYPIWGSGIRHPASGIRKIKREERRNLEFREPWNPELGDILKSTIVLAD
jgi:hypothetical protein